MKNVTDVSNLTELSRGLTMELTDSEVQDVFRVFVEIQSRYQNKPATEANLNALQDEIITKMYERNILVNFDPTPLLEGGAPEVEIVGKVKADDIHKYGFDHEKMAWEVKRANDRSENVLGETG